MAGEKNQNKESEGGVWSQGLQDNLDRQTSNKETDNKKTFSKTDWVAMR